MEVVGGTENGKTKARPSGRKDGNKQAAVPDEAVLDKGIENIVALMVKANAAGEELSEAVKGLAEKSGFLASVVRTLASAKVKDTVADKKREIRQMSLAFGVDD